MNTVRRSIILSLAGKYTAAVVQLVATLVLARILSPSEIGVFSVAVVLVGLAHMVRDFGVGQYIIQEKELTNDRISTAFGITLVIAWFIAGILYSISSLVGDFYQEDRLSDVIEVLAFNFILIPFSSIVISLINRNMNFSALYVITSASAVVHAFTAITLALMGFGVMSMAWAAMAGVVTTIVVANRYRPENLPILPNFREYRRVLSFGGMASAATIVREVGRGAPEAVMGRVLGMDAVGFFSRSMGSVKIFDRLFMSSILLVALPHFAKKHRAGDGLKESYLKAVSYVTGLAWPFFGFLVVLAYPTIRILYGPQWDASVPIVQVLGIYAAINTLYCFSDRIFVATGHLRKNLTFQLILQLTTFILILMLVSINMAAVATALVCGSIIGFVVSYKLLNQTIGITLNDIFCATYKSALVAALTLIVPVSVTLLFAVGPQKIWEPFIIALVGTACAWLGAIFWLKHPLRPEIIQIYQMVKSTLRTKA